MGAAGKALGSPSYVLRYAPWIYFLALLIEAHCRHVRPLNPCHTSFLFQSFNGKPSVIYLLGDAEVANSESVVQISRSSARIAGHLMYGKPIRMLEPLGRLSSVSFSSQFSFSMSSRSRDGLAFMILPRGYPSQGLDGQWFGLSLVMGSVSHIPNMFAVEFDSAMNREVNDLNGNHVGVDIESLISIRSADVSEVDLILNDGTQLHAWIDYDARLKNLEVRLSKSSLVRLATPLISYSVDLSVLWKEEMYAGISSSTSNSPQTNLVYSWSFTSSPFSQPLHSQPVNPSAFMRNGQSSFYQRTNDIMDILIALLFGAGYGAMAALSMFLVWTFFASRYGFVSIEYAVNLVDVGYEKITITNNKEDVNNIK